MQQKKTYKTTGLFVIAGFLCFFGIIAYYAGSKFAVNKRDMVVMYFQESVRGLSVGSSVVLNGVEVGKVAKIKLVTNLQDGTFQAPVYITFDAYKNSGSLKSEKHTLKNLIKKGLRAKLISANYLTGQLMIELFMDPSQPAVMRGDGDYMEIPTEYSSFAMISKDLQDVPLREILSQLSDILGDIDKNLPQIMENVGTITARVNEDLPALMKNVDSVTSNVSKITAKVANVMDKKDNETTRTIGNLNNTLEEVSKASRSLKNLTDYLERHPESLIKGKEK